MMQVANERSSASPAAVTKYKEFAELPDFELVVPQNGYDMSLAPSRARWSGSCPPPPVGAIVFVRMNRIGASQVIGYFVEDNWLGLLIKPIDPPDWFVRQNGYNAKGHVFGAEIEPGKVPMPVLTGPTQAQLAALQRFADAKGRSWKSILRGYWFTGQDEQEEDSALLRQVRNEFGLNWLHGKKNPITCRRCP